MIGSEWPCQQLDLARYVVQLAALKTHGQLSSQLLHPATVNWLGVLDRSEEVARLGLQSKEMARAHKYPMNDSTLVTS